MTLDVALSRWWIEVGQHHKNGDTTLWSMEWLKAFFGPTKLLEEISDSDVARMIARRRGDKVPNSVTKKRPEGRLVGPATVNRTVIQPLRQVMLRAERVWKVKVGEVHWSGRLLDEPQERVREATPDEESAIMQELAIGYDLAVEFAFLTGCRRMEILGLEWTRVDFFNKQFTIIGKGGRQRILPMTERVREIFWGEQGRHPDQVFTYEAARTVRMKDGRLLERGARYPLTEAGLKTAMRRAVSDAGVVNFRFHDTRHTAATRVLRKSNLRVAQLMLGHTDVKTTTKYAHAQMSDVRAAMEAAATTVTADFTAEGEGVGSKSLREKKNSA
ncbi:site-specific integrase [Tianweitania sediminis]|uniref:Site-specific integrase n=2 Tax=Tianweitania sediminis TaxID=1502156 RepID=A0A8J7R2E4_9HYPH|nr:site-specific integrase [Tianweitania sediminis]